MHIWIIEYNIHDGPWTPSVASIFYLRKEDALEEVRARNKLKRRQHFNKLGLRVRKYKR